MTEKPKNDNLQLPCRSGQNTDASGFPEDLPISSLYAKFAQRAVPEEMRAEIHLANGTTYGEALTMALYNAAIKGSVPAAREIRESIEGKAGQRRSPGARNFEVVVTYEPPLSPMLPKGHRGSGKRVTKASLTI
jgi:hypothetical protein